MQGSNLMPFGRYVGKPLDSVPAPYLLWLFNKGCHHEGVRAYIMRNIESIKQTCKNIKRK